MNIFDSDYVPNLFEALSECLCQASRLPVGEDYEFFQDFPDFSSAVSSQLQAVKSCVDQIAHIVNLDSLDYSSVQSTSELCIGYAENALISLAQPLESLERCKPLVRHISDNSEYASIPQIKKKYNSQVPLSKKISVFQDFQLGDGDWNIQKQMEFEHPYQKEIASLVANWDKNIEVLSLSTSFKIITDKAALKKCVQELSDSHILGVAVKSSTSASYYGLTSFISLSSFTKTYIIDVFPIFEHIYKLGKLMTDPRIIKVMHEGLPGLMDLQRDFGIYMVNLFDTAVASEELEYSCRSLSFLIKSFCDTDLSKQPVSLNWSYRPISQDTSLHLADLSRFLPYICCKILEEAQTEDIFHKCKDLTLLKYEKPIKENPIIIQDSLKIPKIQKLMNLRDTVARIEDENPENILKSSSVISFVCYEPSSKEQLLSIDSSEFAVKLTESILEIINGKTQNAKKELVESPEEVEITMYDVIGPEIFTDVCQTLEERAVANRLLNIIKSVGAPEYITPDPIEEIEVLKRKPTMTELDFSNLDALLEHVPIDENRIPSTIQEIFEVSNLNRKKNKKTKTGNESNSRQNSSSKQLGSFMTEIGWGKPAFRQLFN